MPDSKESASKKYHEDGLPIPRRYWAMIAIWLTIIPSILDSSIANVALPLIAKDLNADPAASVWVINAYQLVIVVSLLPLASLGEIVGYRRVFKSGLVLFTLASFLCTQVHTLQGLTLARAFQGLGAACIMAVNGATVRYTFPSRMLGRAIGFNSLVIALSSAVGPSVASGILSIGPWQWLFGINVPLGILALAVGWKTLPSTPHSGGRFHIWSTILNIATFLLAVLAIDGLAQDRGVAVTLAELAGAIIAGFMLVHRSLSQSAPLVPIDLLRIPVFSMSVVTSIASFIAQSLAFVALPFYFIDVLHRSQVDAGLLMTPWPAAVACVAPIVGRLAERHSALMLSGIGSGTLLVGLGLLALLPADATSWDITWRTALCGVGFATFQNPNNKILLSSAPLTRSGAAGGMLATARLTGQTLGAALTAVVFRLASNGEGMALIMAALFAGLAAFLNLRRYMVLNERI
ncbi:MAG TPA: MFS transporter [Stellaceae bacterium]|nr:MFS transporter [Stellaceae bacterium]